MEDRSACARKAWPDLLNLIVWDSVEGGGLDKRETDKKI